MIKNVKRFFGGMLCVAALFAASEAQANFIVNGNFEAATLAPWVQVQPGVNTLVADNGPSAPGVQSVEMTQPNPTTANVLQQIALVGGTLGAHTVNWTLDSKLINLPDGGVGFAQIFASDTTGNILAQSGLINVFAGAPLNQWVARTGSFAAPAGVQQYVVEIQSTTGPFGGTVIRYDNISVVPEPTTFGLAGLGLLGLLSFRRSR